MKKLLYNNKSLRFFMLLMLIGLSIKYIFVDFGIDAEFQIAMSYRLVKGDLMFKEMWEAHQMSAFLCAFFIKIYLLLFQTTTGIVLYLQILGVVIDVSISFLLYKVAQKYLDCPHTAFAMACIFIIVSPKDVPLPEFGNMQIWFSMLLCITLFLYLQTRQKGMLLLSALCLCAAVLSYPSCLILVFGVGFLLFRQGRTKDFFLFLSVCAAVGLLYLCVTLSQLSWHEFLIFFENMMAIETSHAISLSTKLFAYLKDAFKIGLLFVAAYLLAYFFVDKVLGKRIAGDNKTRKLLVDLFFYLLILGSSLYATLDWVTCTRYGYSILFLGIIVIGMRHAKALRETASATTNAFDADPKTNAKYDFYLCGTIISLLNLGATLLLTDLQLIGSIPYLLIAVVAAFIPIAEAFKTINGCHMLAALKKTALLCTVVLLVFRNIYIIRPMYLQTNTIFDVGGVVKEGPAFGIFSTYMGPYMQNETIKEWKEWIPEGSNVYLIGDPLDILAYLYSDTNVAAPSTVCTPGYNENILEYWEMNPHKYPDVVVASCWYGDLNSALAENEWIMNWVEEDFQPTYSIDGKYWRYYFR